MTSLTLYVYVSIVLMNVNIIRPVNITTGLITTITPTLPPTTTTLYPPLSYWDYNVHCKFQSNAFPCDLSRPSPRWYYDIKMGDCLTYTNYKCKSSNMNNFKNYEDCRLQCRDEGPQAIPGDLPVNAACIMQPDFGDCQDYNPMFYYDITERKCKGFAFSGCGGNQNRFMDIKTCQTVCVPATEIIAINARLRDARDDFV